MKTQADIFPVNDEHFLLATGNSVQLIERKTLSTIRRLDLADPESNCEAWRVVSSMDGTSFGVSQICHTQYADVSELRAYTTADFDQFASWKTKGRSLYALLDKLLLRQSTDNRGYSHDLFLYTPGIGETTIHSRNLVEEGLFLNKREIFCCRRGLWLGILALDGQEVAYRDIDPNQEPVNPKALTDQIFVSRTGQRMGALIFHVLWGGSLRWECVVFDRSLQPLLRIIVPIYHNDLTAVFSPDDKYAFVLRDANVSAYSVPQSQNP